ncbi:MAG: hypothetical protein PHC75_09075 [Burkholderiales bacterium]|nr:hypothetical protein [Burkholderiales bacterium]
MATSFLIKKKKPIIMLFIAIISITLISSIVYYFDLRSSHEDEVTESINSYTAPELKHESK